jgi:hypothetical protein
MQEIVLLVLTEEYAYQMELVLVKLVSLEINVKIVNVFDFFFEIER